MPSRRRRKADGVQTPVAYLNCNFSPPVGGKPALFTHDEVITLFHEFGHGLHHLLTRVDDLGVSGINGVEWDAVELPSQFMENFCWEWDVRAPHDAPRRYAASRCRARCSTRCSPRRTSRAACRRCASSSSRSSTCALHCDFDPDGAQTVAAALLDEVRAEVAVLVPPAYNRFPNSFSHIFAGGYAAGYYSYKWAEVLSADAYSLFEEARRARSRSRRALPATRSSAWAAAARRWIRSSRSAAASRRSTRCCATVVWWSTREPDTRDAELPMKNPALLALVFALTPMLVAGAQLYRWVDEKGNVEWRDTPPPPNAKKVEQRNMGRQYDRNLDTPVFRSTGRQEISRDAVGVRLRRAVRSRASASAEARRAARRAQRAKGTRRAQEHHGLAGSARAPRRLQAAQGVLESDWDAALDSAGYPKTALPGVKVKPAAQPSGKSEKEGPRSETKQSRLRRPDRKIRGQTHRKGQSTIFHVATCRFTSVCHFQNWNSAG